MKPKKSYGQHFLTNELIAEKIANSLHLKDSYSKVLEVGPGKGVLTKYLTKQDCDFFAIEADKDMVHYLEDHYPELKGKLILANFLKVNLTQVIGEEPFALIGNFPYNISSQIVFKMIDYKDSIPEMVGMFQKEVAERIVAPPGSKTYGVLSVLTQAHYEGEYLFTVKNSNFFPPPKVQSGVIRLKRKEDEQIYNRKLFKQIVKATFGQRRKMLRNSLKSVISDTNFLQDPILEKRPERLSVNEFIQLTHQIEQINNTQSN